MYCYHIYNRSFVVRISRSVICPLRASSQGLCVYDRTHLLDFVCSQCEYVLRHSRCLNVGAYSERGALYEALTLTWMASISTRRVVQDNNTGQVIVYYRQIFNITT